MHNCREPQIGDAHQSGAQGAHVHLALNAQINEGRFLREGKGKAGKNQGRGLGQGLGDAPQTAEGSRQDGGIGFEGVVAADGHNQGADQHGNHHGSRGNHQAAVFQRRPGKGKVLFHAVTPPFPPVIRRPSSISSQTSWSFSATILPS